LPRAAEEKRKVLGEIHTMTTRIFRDFTKKKKAKLSKRQAKLEQQSQKTQRSLNEAMLAVKDLKNNSEADGKSLKHSDKTVIETVKASKRKRTENETPEKEKKKIKTKNAKQIAKKDKKEKKSKKVKAAQKKEKVSESGGV
jgi:hypothetical protein